MRFSARILGILLSLLVVLFLVKTTFAQTSFPTQSIPIQQFATPNTDPSVPNNFHTWTQNVILEVMSSVVCQLVGIDPINPKQQCLGIDQQTGKLGYVNSGGGAIGMVGSMMGSLYTVPVRFGDYMAYVSDNFGLAKQTLAAAPSATGQIGYDSLLPVLKLWKTFRDISYLMFVLVFLVIGIAIMLRANIDARTVMTIQNQIPKLIIGIILVTFSYAIAGFLIDIMWIGNYLVVSTIAPDTTLNTDTTIRQTAQGAPGFVNYVFENTDGGINLGGTVAVTLGASNQIGDIIENMFSPDKNKAMAVPTTGQKSSCTGYFCLVSDIFNNAGSFVSDVISNILGWIISWVVRIVGYLIIGIALLWAMLKLWFALIKAYVFVLIDVVIAPFWIVAGIFPKAPPSLGFGSWLRDLIANLAVFPTVIALFMFGRAALDNFGSAYNASQFNPPLVGATTGTTGIGSLIALGIILMAPGIADAIKKAIKTSGPPTGFGGVAVGAAALGAVGGAVGRRMYFRDSQGNTHGLAANAQRYATQRLYDSPVGKPLRKYADNPNSRLNRWFGYSAEKQKAEREARQKAREEANTGTTGTQPVRDYSADRGEGPKGDTGPQGPQGPQGPAAPPAT